MWMTFFHWEMKHFREKIKTEILGYSTFTKRQVSKINRIHIASPFGKKSDLLTRLSLIFYNYQIKMIAWTPSSRPKEGKHFCYYSESVWGGRK